MPQPEYSGPQMRLSALQISSSSVKAMSISSLMPRTRRYQQHLHSGPVLSGTALASRIFTGQQNGQCTYTSPAGSLTSKRFSSSPARCTAAHIPLRLYQRHAGRPTGAFPALTRTNVTARVKVSMRRNHSPATCPARRSMLLSNSNKADGLFPQNSLHAQLPHIALPSGTLAVRPAKSTCCSAAARRGGAGPVPPPPACCPCPLCSPGAHRCPAGRFSAAPYPCRNAAFAHAQSAKYWPVSASPPLATQHQCHHAAAFGRM